MKLSIIIPILNEAETIVSQLQLLRAHLGPECEIIIVDGGSHDASVQLSQPYIDDSVLAHTRGRAAQMNLGAQRASGDVLLFLHVDTSLPKNFASELAASPTLSWGFFPLLLSGKSWAFRVIEFFINVRSRCTRVATGDQAIFIRRSLFESLTGFADIPLMEDVELSKRLRKLAAPTIPRSKVVSSSRRWEKNGILATVLLMWRLRFLYFCGVSADKLSSQYYSK